MKDMDGLPRKDPDGFGMAMDEGNEKGDRKCSCDHSGCVFLLVMGEKCGKILKRKDIMSTSEFQAHRSARDCIRRSARNHGRLLTWKNGKKYFKKGRE